MIIILSTLSALVFLLLLALSLLVTHSIWGWPRIGRVAPSASSFSMIKDILDYMGHKYEYVYLSEEKSEVRFYITYNELPFTIDALLRPGSRAICLALPLDVEIPVPFIQDALMACNALNRYKGLRYRAILTSQEGPLTAEAGQRPLKIALIATHQMEEERIRRRAELFHDMLREGFRCSESLLREVSQALDAAQRRLNEARTKELDSEIEADSELHEDQMRMQALLDFLDPQHTLS